MRLILTSLIIIGGLVAVQPVFSRQKVIALWSDFKAFSARVAAHDDGKAILALGGESDTESFEDLVRKLWELKCCTAVPYLGFAVSALSALALVLDIRKKKSVEQDAAPNSRPPSQLPTSPGVQSPDSQRTPSSGGCGWKGVGS